MAMSGKKLLTFLTISVFALFIWPVGHRPPVGGIVNINIFGRQIKARIADSAGEREKGLSSQKSLKSDEGILFVFDKSGYYGFWMKEMNFPIDIIWIDENWKVIGINKNLKPESYPKIYYPPKPVKYVLEISAKFPSW